MIELVKINDTQTTQCCSSSCKIDYISIDCVSNAQHREKVYTVFLKYLYGGVSKNLLVVVPAVVVVGCVCLWWFSCLWWYINIYYMQTVTLKGKHHGILMSCLSCAFHIVISCNHHVSYVGWPIVKLKKKQHWVLIKDNTRLNLND
jgi:hypothetical protein